MKKLFLPVLLLVSFNAAIAQTGPTPEEKALLFNKIDTLLTNYIRYSRFLEGANANINPEAINNFRQLFVSENVMLPDEMSPAYFSKQKIRPKVPSYDSMNTEAAKLKNKVPVSNPQNINSISKLNALTDSLNSYSKGLNEDRKAFYQVVDHLNKNMADYNAEMLSQEKLVTRSLDELIVMVEANYPEGFSVNLLNSVVSFKSILDNEVKLLIEKKTDGKLYGSSVRLQNIDTLLLTLQISENYSKLQISNIEMIGYRLNFLNDKDHDFISDPIDACPEDNGLFQLTGCPPANVKNFTTIMAAYLSDRRADSIKAVAIRPAVEAKTQLIAGRIAGLQKLINAPPRWMITVGGNAGAVSSTLTNAGNGYLANISSREINPVSSFSGGKSFGGDVMGEHYFGTKSNFGIGLGIAFNSISGKIKKDAFHVEYKGKDEANLPREGDKFFTQIITANSVLEEKVSVSNLAVPILAIYKGSITNAIGFRIEAGIAVNVSYKSTMSTRSGLFDYEAVYKYPNSGAQGIDFFDPGTATGFDESSWLITKAHVADHIGLDKRDLYFKKMEESKYPVGLNVSPKSSNSTASFGSGISFIFRPSISFNLSKANSINLGVFYSYTSVSQSGGYKLIDEQRTYNTLMQGVSKMSNSSFGIRLSYSFSLFYYLSKWTKELSGLR